MAAASDGPSPGLPLMSIGEVLAYLREDYPDVSISKLRFLEAEGLVMPQRTGSGYRKYSRDDLARLDFVLAAQRDRFLPLRVIRDHLAALDRGEPGVINGVPPRRPSLTSAPAVPHDGRAEARISRAALLAQTGLTDGAVTELEEAC